MPLDPCALSHIRRTHITLFIREPSVNGVRGWKAYRPQLPTIVTFHLPSLSQWLPKCAPRIPRDRDQFPGDPWIHFCNGCFEVYFL